MAVRTLGAILIFALWTAACTPGGPYSATGGGAPQAAPAQPAAPAAVPAQPLAPAAVPAQPLAPAAPSASGQPLAFEIQEVGENFRPARITVKAGAPVRFLVRNDDADQHNVMSSQIQLPQSVQDPGSTSTIDWIAPQRPGTYDIFCAFHAPGMKMEVVVE